MFSSLVNYVLFVSGFMSISLLAQLAFDAHDGQKRRSGEPFIIHPVEVARILGELVSYVNYVPFFINYWV